MNTGKIITDLRKERNWSQTDLANKSEVSREMIGKYERSEAIPSIEAAKKIADALEVTLDYLVGEGTNAKFDKKILKRIQEIHQLSEEERKQILMVMDALLRDFKAKKVYS